jgi:hypothetical protein
MAEAQKDLVYAAFILLVLYLYILSTFDIRWLSNYAAYKNEVDIRMIAMPFSLLGATLIFNDMLYRQKRVIHWAFIIAYIGAGVYTVVRFFSDLLAAETFSDYWLTIAVYSLLVAIFTSSTDRPLGL